MIHYDIYTNSSSIYIFFSCYDLSLLVLSVQILSVKIEDSIMGDSSASYIHMVQHLIEKCLIFNMTKEECMEALSKHAKIEPVITSTVWKELEKENKEFFESYSQSQSKEGDRMSEAETSAMIQRMISDSSQDSTDK